MSLKIGVKSASNLRNVEHFGKSDPYTTICFQGVKQKTQVKESTLSPEWNEELSWDIDGKAPRSDESIEIIVKDYERIGPNRLLGKTDIPLRNIIHGGTGTLELDQNLLDSNNQPTTGTIKLSITYNPPKRANQGQSNVVSSGPMAQATVASAIATSGDLADGTTPGDADLLEGQTYSGGMPTTGGIKNTRARDNLTKVKTKFQIRVRVVEARQLMGSDISPVCRVGLRGSTQQTRVHKGTVSPWFDEIFFFHEECLPSDLFDDFIEFKVCNSSILRAGTIIGSFKCEIGQVYDTPDHTLHNKWLVLAHPDEPTPTVQGYLKVSMSVLGPGDVCKDLKASSSTTDDIEANLLWSAGVHLQPATFKLSIFCAQNLPRMDAGTMQSLKEIFKIGKASKELVDPYVVVSYAGREVQTKVLYTNDNPEFKQQLNLGFLFPSMCNTLKITLMDWDRVGQDDVIGTAVIPIDAVSAPGDEGYLPSFGPSFLNVYGARREWELWQSGEEERMNVGADEGCAYRGRVLVSLETSVGSYPPSPICNMDDSMFNKARLFRSTRDFVLLAHLTHVSLLREAGRPLELEVSMGNFGNKLENSLIPSPSSSHPSNPVFDGCKYYYLPWEETSPFITLQCQWEDVTHRLFASNSISYIARELKFDLDLIKSKLSHRHLHQQESLIQELVNKTLNRLINHCSESQPSSDPIRNAETSLDAYQKKRRVRQLHSIQASAKELISSDVNKALEELEGLLNQLNNLAVEPQGSIPDVFIWLMSGTERLAYARVPAADVIYSFEHRWGGINAGKFTSLDLKIPGKDDIGGNVRISLWLAREEEQRFWWDARTDLQLTVYAECYENQAWSVTSGNWSNSSSLMTRPPFSDSDGLRALPKEAFEPSEGWGFQGDWVVDPDPSIRFTVDAGHHMYTEEVFQHQMRVPGGTWADAPTTWADARGDPGTPRDEITCPDGWQWRDVWVTDVQRAVDAEGWEYTVQKGVTGWSPQQKVYHVLRRRRWMRERVRTQKVSKEEGPIDGWEYAMLFGLRFHARKRKVDVVRRRRWRRKLVPLDPGLPPTPRIFIQSQDKKEEGSLITCPRQYIVSAEVHKYQLRAHIYQARDLVAGDKTGLSDPYAIVSFCGGTQQTEKQATTLSPTWDQTLMFDEVTISGQLLPVSASSQMPPAVYVEIYDWDARGEPDFLGRVSCIPEVKDTSAGYDYPQLQWFSLSTGAGVQGEMLAAFELLLKDTGDLPMPPPSRGDIFMVPFGVRPILQRTRIEILCWGVRNMSTYELQSVTRPSIEFECGGQVVTSSVMKNLRLNPNFDEPHLLLDVELPKDDKYMPPLTMRVMDHRAFGSKPVVATAAVQDLFQYMVEPKANSNKPPLQARTTYGKSPKSKKDLKVNVSPELSHTQASLEPGTVDTEIDWWAKYYASGSDTQRSGGYLHKGYERLEILGQPLESDNRFSCFTDLVDTITLMRGRGEEAKPSGQFKGTFRIYPVPGDGDELPKLLEGFPSPSPHEVTARVYVVEGRDLAPKDAGGASDPYITVSLGKQHISGKKEYRPNTLNPIFGRMFEVSGTLPVYKDLKIQVWDYDSVTSDDLIGETVIDLENRFLSRHRATVGLARQYHVTGPNMWRDSELPSEILEMAAKLRHLDGPNWESDSCLVLSGKTHRLQDYEPEGQLLPSTLGEPKERLSLYVIHDCLPLVPEHVETRDLMHPSRPGLPQGKLLLWVDLFPSDVSIPPAIDITPRKPHGYEIRVCILNVYEAPLQESNIAGEKMSDLYVKGWLQGTNNVGKTDIHYRSLDGEGNFNWRLIFPLDYLEAEQMMVVHRKSSVFSLDKTEERRPPQLTLQLWDNDLLLRDDYLSEMTLDLCHMPKPAKTVNKVTLPVTARENGDYTTTSDGNSTFLSLPKDDHSTTSYVNLWEVKRVYGFFPFTTVVDGKLTIAGKLEAEIEVVHEDDAKIRPAGHGRADPNNNPTLPEPKRPATSFFWLSSPWKSFRHVLWKNYKWYIITFIVVFLLALFMFLFIYALPGATIDYLIGVE